jgi:hypothetical protein
MGGGDVDLTDKTHNDYIVAGCLDLDGEEIIGLVLHSILLS